MKSTKNQKLYISLRALLFVLLAIPLIGFSRNFLNEMWQSPYDPEKHKLLMKRFGHGPKVLFIHGLAGSSSYWQSRLGDFSKHHEVILVDLLGFGLSPKPKSSYDLQVHASAIQELITREIKPDTEKILVVGHSMGAMIGLKLLKDSPERFSGAVLIALPIYHDRVDAATYIGKISPMYAATFNGDLWIQLSCYLRDFYRFPFLAKYFDLPVDVFLDGTQHTWNSLSGSINHTVASANSEQLVSTTKNRPLLFIHGDNDEIAPFVRAKEISLKYQKPFHAIKGGNHHVFISHTHEIVSLIDDFSVAQVASAQNKSKGAADQ